MARTALFHQFRRLLYAAMAVERNTLRLDEALHLLRHRREGLSDLLRSPLDRRRFLGGTALGLWGASGLSAITACRTPDGKGAQLRSTPLPDGEQREERVVIVGAGTAGLTTAYRLLRAGVKSAVYEGSERCGGRMYTEAQFNRDNMFVERGGELVDSQHLELIELCTELGLKLQELAADPAGASREFYFAGGKPRTEAEMIEALRPLAAAVLRDSSALTVDGSQAFPSIKSPLATRPELIRLDRLSLAAYLGQISADPWILELIKVIYVGEFGLEPAEQSALNLLTLFAPDFAEGLKVLGSSDESKRIAGGSESLPRALHDAIQAAVPIHLGHRLVAVTGRGTDFELSFDSQGGPVTVHADRVVLAVPLPLLREISFKGLELPPVVRSAILELGFGSNAKLMLGLKSRVWHQPGNAFGFVLYTDTSTQELWDTSRGQQGASGIVTNFRGGNSGRIATPAMPGLALSELSRVFPGAAEAFDGNKLLQHWPSAPFTKGSYTCLKPGQYTSLYGAFSDPVLNGRLVFAGEHSSIDWSGFMNGAVASGNSAATALLGQRR